MKKLFKISSVILAVAMLCMMFVVPASAATAGAAISLGLDATALPGETVTIPVRAENMQGVAALEFTVDLGGLTDATVQAGTWTNENGYLAGVAVKEGSIKVANYINNPSKDVTGTLFSIVATVPSTDCTVSVDGNSVLAFDLNEDVIAVAGDSVNITAYAVKYDNTTLVMGETVDLKLYFKDNSTAINPDLVVTAKALNVDGEEVTTEYTAEKVQNSDTLYSVKIPRYSFEMQEEVTVTASYTVDERPFIAAENLVVKVQDYFDKAAALTDTTDLSQEAFNCLYAMAKYGAVAAEYFSNDKMTYEVPLFENENVGYQNGDIHSSADVDLSSLIQPEVDPTAVEVDENGDAVAEPYSVSLSDKIETLVLSSEICFKLYTEVAIEELVNYTYSYGKLGTDIKDFKELGAEMFGTYNIGEDTYATIKVPVKAYESGETFLVRASDAEGNTVAIVKYVAPDSYIARTWDSSDAYAKNGVKLRTMLSALKVYGNTAKAYHAAQ